MAAYSDVLYLMKVGIEIVPVDMKANYRRK